MSSTRNLPDHLTENVSSKSFVYRHPNYHRRKSVLFSYAHGGDRESAKAKAIAYAIEKDAILGPPPPRSPEGRMSRCNTSGFVGVNPGDKPIRKPSGIEYTYYHWKAEWIGCPNSGGVAWQCKTLTDDGAYVLAVLTRRLRTVNRGRMLEELKAISRGVGSIGLFSPKSRGTLLPF
jgi:hypothetical protein